MPTDVSGVGEFRYRVTARYMDATGKLHAGAAVEESISLRPETIAGFVNVAFTRGFASSQAYADRFNNETGILPPVNAPAKASLSHDMTPFPKQYDWLGFEVRRLIYQLLDEVIADPSQKLDALIYECKEPEILKRLEKLGPRLRAVIDDHADQGEPDSCETISADRLKAAGAQVKRMHFARQQHNKVLIVRKNGLAVRALGGSTNFSLRGLYIQANNALLFESDVVAAKFAEVFDAYWASASSATTPRAVRNSSVLWRRMISSNAAASPARARAASSTDVDVAVGNSDFTDIPCSGGCSLDADGRKR